jgi:hypothetical protein
VPDEPDRAGIMMEHVSGLTLPPGRWEELQPRLLTLLADFDELKAIESPELEPMPSFRIEREAGDARD